MVYAKISLYVALPVFLSFSCNGMQQRSLLEILPLEIWHEIIQHLPGNNKFLNYLSRIVALPSETYDKIALTLVIEKEDFPTPKEIETWVNDYFKTTKYQPLRKSMQLSLLKTIQIIQSKAPDMRTLPELEGATIKHIKLWLGIARYRLKLADQSIFFLRLTNKSFYKLAFFIALPVLIASALILLYEPSLSAAFIKLGGLAVLVILSMRLLENSFLPHLENTSGKKDIQQVLNQLLRFKALIESADKQT